MHGLTGKEIQSEVRTIYLCQTAPESVRVHVGTAENCGSYGCNIGDMMDFVKVPVETEYVAFIGQFIL